VTANRVLIFGPTGTAGGSVVQACLATDRVSEVRTVSRRPLKYTHPKLKSFIHTDYLNHEAEAFTGVDACLFCLGISVNQTKSEDEYRRITHDYAVAAARMLKKHSPQAIFHYLSGKSADLESRFMWARVKAQTEAELMRDFDAVCWRPGSIDGADSDNAPRAYQIFRPILRILKPFRSLYITGEDIGRAMLQATVEGRSKQIHENRAMRALAEKWNQT
jgi:uncharacterized protein YbjT (DUF2867 family)